MKEIINKFKDYNLEYDPRDEILFINKEMPVKVFLTLRKMLKGKPVKDIRLEVIQRRYK